MDLKDISLYVDDRPADGVFRVHRDVYSDPELFELEHKFIFERTWNFLALESQIRKPNDFVTGHIGRTPVLATRDAKGSLRAFVNVCRTRARCCAGPRRQREISRLPVSRLGLRRLGQERRRSRTARREAIPPPSTTRTTTSCRSPKVAKLQGLRVRQPLGRRSAARGFPRRHALLHRRRRRPGSGRVEFVSRALGVYPTAATGSCSSTTASIPITSRPRISRTWTCRRGAAEARPSGGAPVRLGEAQLRRRRDLRARARPRRDLARSARAREAADLPGARGDPRARRRAARRMDAQGAQRARLPQHADRRRDHADAAHFPAARSGPHRDAELLPRPVGEAGEQRAWAVAAVRGFLSTPGAWRRRTTQ